MQMPLGYSAARGGFGLNLSECYQSVSSEAGWWHLEGTNTHTPTPATATTQARKHGRTHIHFPSMSVLYATTGQLIKQGHGNCELHNILWCAKAISARRAGGKARKNNLKQTPIPSKTIDPTVRHCPRPQRRVVRQQTAPPKERERSRPRQTKTQAAQSTAAQTMRVTSAKALAKATLEPRKMKAEQTTATKLQQISLNPQQLGFK